MKARKNHNQRICGLERHLWRSSTQTPSQSRKILITFLRTISSWYSSAFKDEDSFVCLGNLLTTLTVKIFLFMFKWNFLNFLLCLMPLVPSISFLYCSSCRHLYTSIKAPLEPSQVLNSLRSFRCSNIFRPLCDSSISISPGTGEARTGEARTGLALGMCLLLFSALQPH